MSSKNLTPDRLAQLRQEAKDSGFLLCTRAMLLIDEIERLRQALEASELAASSASAA